MSKLFLLDQAVNLNDFDDFKDGMNNLITIDKKDEDAFYKHDSIYNIPILTTLYSTFGQDEQEISRFIEQLTLCEDYIDTEIKADIYCNTNCNAFLGIDFSKTSISNPKQIIDNKTYFNWNFGYLSNYEKLIFVLGSCHLSSKFEKDFNNLAANVQTSIIDDFKKAKNRNLPTPFYHDTKIISDVTPKTHKCKVMELRVYTPIALRVYFNENKGKVFVASIEQKSNANQSADIDTAHNILNKMISSI